MVGLSPEKKNENGVWTKLGSSGFKKLGKKLAYKLNDSDGQPKPNRDLGGVRS